jgi:cell division protein ZapA
LKTAHSVRVLGREISVRSSAPAEKVHAVESFVNERLQEIGSALKSGDAQLVLTLALLNTAEEMLELRAAREADTPLESRLLSMIEKLETA